MTGNRGCGGEGGGWRVLGDCSEGLEVGDHWFEWILRGWRWRGWNCHGGGDDRLWVRWEIGRPVAEDAEGIMAAFCPWICTGLVFRTRQGLGKFHEQHVGILGVLEPSIAFCTESCPCMPRHFPAGLLLSKIGCRDIIKYEVPRCLLGAALLACSADVGCMQGTVDQYELPRGMDTVRWPLSAILTTPSQNSPAQCHCLTHWLSLSKQSPRRVVIRQPIKGLEYFN